MVFILTDKRSPVLVVIGAVARAETSLVLTNVSARDHLTIWLHIMGMKIAPPKIGLKR